MGLLGMCGSDRVDRLCGGGRSVLELLSLTT